MTSIPLRPSHTADSQKLLAWQTHASMATRRLSVINEGTYRETEDMTNTSAPRHRHLEPTASLLPDHCAVAGGHRRASHRCDSSTDSAFAHAVPRSGACPGSVRHRWEAPVPPFAGNSDTSPAAPGSREAE